MRTPPDIPIDAISDEEYEHYKRVVEAVGCKTFGDYVRLYCKIDVFLLAIIFENFIDTSMRETIQYNTIQYNNLLAYPRRGFQN